MKWYSETYGKNNLYSYCTEYGFNKFATIEEKESDVLKRLNIYEAVLQNFLNWRKNPESKNSRVTKISGGRIMIFSKCALCNRKRSNLSKNEKEVGY